MPTGPGGNAYTFVGGSDLMVFKSSEHPNEAWALVKFLSEDQTQKDYASLLGMFPARRTRRASGNILDSAAGVGKDYSEATVKSQLDAAAKEADGRSAGSSTRPGPAWRTTAASSSTRPTRCAPASSGRSPTPRSVAGFIGSPAMNLLRGRVDDDGIWLGDQRLPLHLDALTADMLDAGEDMVDDGCRFIARVPPDLRPAPGEKVRLRVDLDRLHLFDPATEQVIRR